MRGMVRMGRARGWAVAAAAACTVLVAAGCGGGGGDAKAPPSTAAGGTSSSSTAAAPAMTVEQAYAKYQGTMGPGCSTVEECQVLVTARLQAARDLRDAMKADDPARYAEPISDVDRADRLATEFGAGNLGAAGNMQQVLQQVQAAVAWYAGNR